MSSPKRVKLENVLRPVNHSENPKSIILSTGDDTWTRFQPTACLSSNAMVKQPARGSRGNNKEKKGRRPTSKTVIQSDTTSTIARCGSKLHAALHGIQLDRDYLRERWEIDDGLKEQKVTDDLTELNQRFHDAEQAITEAIGIVEGKLLRR